MGYNYKINYKKNTKNFAVDVISRQTEEQLLSISYPLPNWVENVQAKTTSNESLQAAIQQIQDR